MLEIRDQLRQELTARVILSELVEGVIAFKADGEKVPNRSRGGGPGVLTRAILQPITGGLPAVDIVRRQLEGRIRRFGSHLVAGRQMFSTRRGLLGVQCRLSVQLNIYAFVLPRLPLGATMAIEMIG